MIISLLHYFSPVEYHHLHAIYQRLYYIPIVLSAYLFGLRIGLLFALLSAVFYVPHIFFQWSFNPSESFTQYVEVVMFMVIASLVGILADIQRRQRRQIERAARQIRRMDRLSLLGQLAAGLAHEIRNPLGSLIGSNEVLKEKITPDNALREFVEIMDRELHRLRDKLNEFLGFARPAPPQIVPNDLNDVVQAATGLVEKQAARSSVRIRMDLDQSLPLAPMDAEQLKQVLLNLLLNGVQAMPRGGVLLVSTWRESGRLGVSVEDEGTGVSPDQQDKIFDPFYTTKEEGTGLGLAIVRQLVEAVGGSVDVTNGQRGARFEVRIPDGTGKDTGR